MGIKREIFVCALTELPEGTTKHFQYGPSKGIAYNDKGTVKAFVNRCTHMGGPVELTGDGKYLRCRWHGADFHPCSGEAIEGQAPPGTFLKEIDLVQKGGDMFAVLELEDDPFDF